MSWTDPRTMTGAPAGGAPLQAQDIKAQDIKAVVSAQLVRQIGAFFTPEIIESLLLRRPYLAGIRIEPTEGGCVRLTVTDGHAVVMLLDPCGWAAAPLTISPIDWAHEDLEPYLAGDDWERIPDPGLVITDTMQCLVDEDDVKWLVGPLRDGAVPPVDGLTIGATCDRPVPVDQRFPDVARVVPRTPPDPTLPLDRAFNPKLLARVAAAMGGADDTFVHVHQSRDPVTTRTDVLGSREVVPPLWVTLWRDHREPAEDREIGLLMPAKLDVPSDTLPSWLPKHGQGGAA